MNRGVQRKRDDRGRERNREKHKETERSRDENGGTGKVRKEQRRPDWMNSPVPMHSYTRAVPSVAS